MPIWNKLKQELDRAGQVAQEAIDEGRDRLDAFRARQLADKAAQALGYAVYYARQKGTELDADTYSRLSSTIAAHEAEEARAKKRDERAGERSGESSEPKAESSEPPQA
jgi:signal transduction histidine kinase